jgi:catechol 2,3-dioxygenase-like lactoylglutathione lyase family enzyme
MGLHRLLSMRVGVPDPAGLGAFYGELGLTSDGNGGFAGTDAGTQLVVDHHAFRRLLEVRIGATDDATLADIAARLTGHGLQPRHTGGVLSVVDPAIEVTFRVEVAAPFVQQAVGPAAAENRPGVNIRRNARAAAVTQSARPPRRLGHLVIGTPDLAGTRALLVDGLGFKPTDEFPGIISFLRCSFDHHNIGLVNSPVPLLQHYSWECDDVDHVGYAATALLRTDARRQAWGFGRHFIGSNYYWYLHDPSGSFIELYSDLDQIDDDAAWEATGRTPFLPSQIGHTWGPAMPAEFIAPTDLDTLQAGWAASH